MSQHSNDFDLEENIDDDFEDLPPTHSNPEIQPQPNKSHCNPENHLEEDEDFEENEEDFENQMLTLKRKLEQNDPFEELDQRNKEKDFKDESVDDDFDLEHHDPKEESELIDEIEREINEEEEIQTKKHKEPVQIENEHFFAQEDDEVQAIKEDENISEESIGKPNDPNEADDEENDLFVSEPMAKDLEFRRNRANNNVLVTESDLSLVNQESVMPSGSPEEKSLRLSTKNQNHSARSRPNQNQSQSQSKGVNQKGKEKEKDNSRVLREQVSKKKEDGRNSSRSKTPTKVGGKEPQSNAKPKLKINLPLGPKPESKENRKSQPKSAIRSSRSLSKEKNQQGGRLSSRGSSTGIKEIRKSNRNGLPPRPVSRPTSIGRQQGSQGDLSRIKQLPLPSPVAKFPNILEIENECIKLRKELTPMVKNLGKLLDKESLRAFGEKTGIQLVRPVSAKIHNLNLTKQSNAKAIERMKMELQSVTQKWNRFFSPDYYLEIEARINEMKVLLDSTKKENKKRSVNNLKNEKRLTVASKQSNVERARPTPASFAVQAPSGIGKKFYEAANEFKAQMDKNSKAIEKLSALKFQLEDLKQKNKEALKEKEAVLRLGEQFGIVMEDPEQAKVKTLLEKRKELKEKVESISQSLGKMVGAKKLEAEKERETNGELIERLQKKMDELKRAKRKAEKLQSEIDSGQGEETEGDQKQERSDSDTKKEGKVKKDSRMGEKEPLKEEKIKKKKSILTERAQLKNKGELFLDEEDNKKEQRTTNGNGQLFKEKNNNGVGYAPLTIDDKIKENNQEISKEKINETPVTMNPFKKEGNEKKKLKLFPENEATNKQQLKLSEPVDSGRQNVLNDGRETPATKKRLFNTGSNLDLGAAGSKAENGLKLNEEFQASAYASKNSGFGLRNDKKRLFTPETGDFGPNGSKGVELHLRISDKGNLGANEQKTKENEENQPKIGEIKVKDQNSDNQKKNEENKELENVGAFQFPKRNNRKRLLDLQDRTTENKEKTTQIHGNEPDQEKKVEKPIEPLFDQDKKHQSQDHVQKELSGLPGEQSRKINAEGAQDKLNSFQKPKEVKRDLEIPLFLKEAPLNQQDNPIVNSSTTENQKPLETSMSNLQKNNTNSIATPFEQKSDKSPQKPQEIQKIWGAEPNQGGVSLLQPSKRTNQIIRGPPPEEVEGQPKPILITLNKKSDALFLPGSKSGGTNSIKAIPSLDGDESHEKISIVKAEVANNKGKSPFDEEDNADFLNSLQRDSEKDKGTSKKQENNEDFDDLLFGGGQPKEKAKIVSNESLGFLKLDEKKTEKLEFGVLDFPNEKKGRRQRNVTQNIEEPQKNPQVNSTLLLFMNWLRKLG